MQPDSPGAPEHRSQSRAGLVRRAQPGENTQRWGARPQPGTPLHACSPGHHEQLVQVVGSDALRVVLAHFHEVIFHCLWGEETTSVSIREDMPALSLSCPGVWATKMDNAIHRWK